MNVDRLNHYREKLMLAPAADLHRAAWVILLEATREAEAGEREKIAGHFDSQPDTEWHGDSAAHEIRTRCAK